MRDEVRFAVASLVLLAACGAVAAQSGASEASGTVADKQGDPIVGATVKFVPQGNPTVEYTGTTNKKGKYYVSGLWTPKEGDLWDISIEAEGYLPVRVHVESRTVNQVLIGNIMDADIPSGATAPSIMIRPLGRAQVDWTMASAEDVAAAGHQVAGPSPADAGTAEPTDEPKEPPKKDPWEEAVTLANRGDLEGSVPLFEKAIEDVPDDPAAAAERYEAYAKVLYQLERYADAEAPAKKAVEFAPDRLDAHMVLYTVYAGQENWGRAAEVLERAGQVAPDDLRVLEQRAYVASKTGRPGEVVAAYEKMTQLQPDKADAWVALGGLYAEQGDMKKSEAAYRKVVELDPKSAYQTFYNLGVLITNRENRSATDTQRALDAFRKAVEIKPDYGAAHKQLGLLLLETGDRPAAATALEQYLRYQPNATDRAQMQALIAAMRK